MTRVGHLIGEPNPGGGENLITALIRHSDSDEITHIVGCLQAGNDEVKRDLEEAGARVVTFGARSPIDPAIVRYIHSFLRSEGIDILHIHGFHAIAGRIIGRLLGRGVITTHHNAKGGHGIVLNATEHLTRPLDSVTVAVSKGVKCSFTDTELWSYNENWSVIHNGLNIEQFRAKVADADVDLLRSQYNLPCDGPVFLNVGRYVTKKGQEDLIRAMSDVITQIPDARLLIVGGYGGLKEQLHQLIIDLGLEDHVRVTGSVPSIYEYYALADVFVLSSRREGFGIVLLEAMTAGLPVIATDIAGVREVIEATAGILVPPESPSEMAEAMIEVARRGENSALVDIDTLAEKFSIERMVQYYMDYYKMIG